MARTGYQYGTSPRKIDPNHAGKTTKKRQLKVVSEAPRQQVKVSKEQRRIHLKSTLIAVGVFLLLLTISCRNSQIDKKFNQIQEQKKELSEIQKENEQLSVSIANSINLINIEKIAKEELGMQKLTTKQTIYVTLPKKDYVESASEKIQIEKEKNVWQKIFDRILNL